MIRQLLELRRILRHHKLPPDELEALRERKLRAVIRNAYDHVPYYRSLFRSAGVSPEDVRTVDDLRKVPITTKEDVRAGGTKHFLADWAYLTSLISARTSGSTGEPLTVYQTPAEQMTGWLLHFASLIGCGLQPRDRYAVYGHKLSLPPWLHRYFRIYQSKVIRQTLSWEEQISKLREFRPTVIRANPPSLRSLLHNVNHPLKELIQPRIIISGAEILDEVLRTRLKAALDSEVLDNYGAVELGHLAWECPTHAGLHLNADHFIFECLRDQQFQGDGQPRVAVVTSLFAFAMPFIRYKLGDLCGFVDGTCSCGICLPLIQSPRGRDNDVVSLPSGRIIPWSEFGRILREIPGLNQWRLIQEKQDHFVLNLVMAENLPDTLIRHIRELCLAYVKEPVRFDIRLVDRMEDGTKFRHFISKVTAPDGR